MRGDGARTCAARSARDERDHAAAETAPGHAGAGGAGVDGGRDGLIGLGPGDPERVAQGSVRGGQQAADRRLVPGAEQVGGAQDAAALGQDVPGQAPQGRVGQPGQLLLGDVPQ